MVGRIGMKIKNQHLLLLLLCLGQVQGEGGHQLGEALKKWGASQKSFSCPNPSVGQKEPLIKDCGVAELSIPSLVTKLKSGGQLPLSCLQEVAKLTQVSAELKTALKRVVEQAWVQNLRDLSDKKFHVRENASRWIEKLILIDPDLCEEVRTAMDKTGRDPEEIERLGKLAGYCKRFNDRLNEMELYASDWMEMAWSPFFWEKISEGNRLREIQIDAMSEGQRACFANLWKQYGARNRVKVTLTGSGCSQGDAVVEEYKKTIPKLSLMVGADRLDPSKKTEYYSPIDSSTADIACLAYFKDLNHLDFGQCKISNLEPLKVLMKLKVLNLSGTQVVDLSPLKELTLLKELRLENTRVMDITPLVKLAKLNELNLKNTLVPEKMIEEMKKSIPSLVIRK